MHTQFLGQNAVENLTTAVVVLDENLWVQFINASAEIMFDISQRQVEHIPFQALLPGEKDLVVSLRKVQQTGHSLIKREMDLYVPSRGDIWVDCAIKLLEVNADHLYILLEFSQLDFKDLMSRDDSLHVQQQVVRGLAHEIKNPLGGLRGAAQLLERQLGSDELKEYTGIIISEADRLQNLMSNLLGSGSHQQTKSSLINIHEVLQRVRQLVLTEADEQLVFMDDYDPSIPEFYANFDELVQVFLNITRNAEQAMSGVGNIIMRTRVQRHIMIENKRHRLGVIIEIEDNGPGILPSMQESMFYPLVTGRAEGTGLGLYLSQSLIHRNHGAISCTSRPSCTVFSIIFPLERADEK